MRYLLERDEAKRLTRFVLEIDDGDLRLANYGPGAQKMIRALERQQEDDPTAEGQLMILQMHVHAIEEALR